MKAHHKKTKNTFYAHEVKNTVQKNRQKPHLIDLCIIIFCGLLPLAATRLSVGSISISVTSIATIILCGIFLTSTKKHVAKVFSRHRTAHLFAFSVGTFVFMIAFMTGTVHGWGIFIEWFLLPISAGLVILDRTSMQEQSIKYVIGGLLLALAGVVLSSLVFAVHSVFTYDGRLYGLWPSANHLALFCAPLLVFATMLLVGCKNLRKKLLLGMLIMLGLYVLYMTKSFGGLIAFAGASLIAYGIQSSFSKNGPKQKKSYIVVLCVIVSIMIGYVALEKFALIQGNAERSSLASRLTIYQVSIDMLRHDPFMGIGLGNFQQEYLALQPYYPPYLEWAVPLPHNTFLAFWLYAGIVGLGIFLFVTLRVLYMFTRLSTQDKQKILPFLAVFFTIMIHGLVDTTFFRQDLSVLYCIAIAMIVSLANPSKERTYSQLT